MAKTSIDIVDHRRQWARRAAETAVGVTRTTRPFSAKPRDKWAIAALLASGEITASQYAAARRLVMLVERAQNPAGGETMKVDVSYRDPHERAYTAALCRLAAADAIHAMMWYPDLPWDKSSRNRVVRAAFSFPAPSLSALRTVYCDSRANVRRIVRILVTALETLEAHWRDCDAGTKRYRVDYGDSP